MMIGSLIAFAIFLGQLINKEDSYTKREGEIVFTVDGNAVVENNPMMSVISGVRSDTYYLAVNIKPISDTRENPYVFIVTDSRYFSLLAEKATKGDRVVVWYDIEGPTRHNRNKVRGAYVKKLVVDNEILVPYHQIVWVHILFMCIAGCVFVICLIYIIRHPAHLRGRQDEPV